MKNDVLLVLDSSKSGAAYGRAKEEDTVSKYGGTVYIVAVRMREQ